MRAVAAEFLRSGLNVMTWASETENVLVKHPAVLLLVRIRTRLPLDEIMARAEKRMPEFRALGGLLQKYYVHDPATGEIGGLYLWESAEALAEYRESELRKTIAEAYEAEEEPRVEVLRVITPLRD